MKVLYLTGDYLYSKVHNNLIKNLLEIDKSLEIYVFSPIRVENAHGLEDSYYNDSRLTVVTPQIDIPLPLYRFDFWAKQRCKIRLIEKLIPIQDIDFIHAATLYAEGATAYRIYKKYGIKYLVSVRGADVMTYSKLMPHLWFLGNKILNNATVISCVTPSIRQKLIRMRQYLFSKNKISDSIIINNGIDPIWINNIRLAHKKLGNLIRVVYIGRFDTNKNVYRLVESIIKLKKYHNISLTLIGGKGEEHDRVIKKVEENSSYLSYLGLIYDKEKLISIVRECDIFAMVSHSETFGLVYAECLTQGMPLVYTDGTGFSGIYPQGYVGYGVNSNSVDSIVDGIDSVISNYDEIQKNISSLDFSMYAWPDIAKKYLQIYNSKESL